MPQPVAGLPQCRLVTTHYGNPLRDDRAAVQAAAAAEIQQIRTEATRRADAAESRAAALQLENIPADGGAVIAMNHISYVVRDWAAADHLGRRQSMLGQPPEAIFIGKAMSLRAIVPG